MSNPALPDPIAILILAAGASSRMRGRDKLLKPIDGLPLLSRVAAVACATGQPVFVTLPEDAQSRRAALADLDVQIIKVADADSGMAASLRAWARHSATGYRGVLIMLADMPEITTDDLHLLIDAFRTAGSDRIIRANDNNQTAGHPVVFPPRLVENFASLTGDQGARRLMSGEKIKFVTLPGQHATTDLDTPEQWQAWHAGRSEY